MAFIDTRLNDVLPVVERAEITFVHPVDISSTRGIIEFRNPISHEHRILVDLGTLVLAENEVIALHDFFRDVSQGTHNSFRYKCPLNFIMTAENEVLDVNTNTSVRGAALNLVANTGQSPATIDYQIIQVFFTDSGNNAVQKTITKPILSTISVFSTDGVNISPFDPFLTVDTDLGVISYDPGLASHPDVLFVDCEFDYEVRFSSDTFEAETIKLPASYPDTTDCAYYRIKNLKLQEVEQVSRINVLTKRGIFGSAYATQSYPDPTNAIGTAKDETLLLNSNDALVIPNKAIETVGLQLLSNNTTLNSSLREVNKRGYGRQLKRIKPSTFVLSEARFLLAYYLAKWGKTVSFKIPNLEDKFQNEIFNLNETTLYRFNSDLSFTRKKEGIADNTLPTTMAPFVPNTCYSTIYDFAGASFISDLFFTSGLGLDQETYIKVFIDSSGSMANSEAAVIDAVDLLRELLKEFIWKTEARTAKYFKGYALMGDERWLNWILPSIVDNPGTEPDKQVFLIYANESFPVYHGKSGEPPVTEPTPQWLSDHATFTTGFSSRDLFRGFVLEVNEGGLPIEFKQHMDDALNGTNGYPEGLANYNWSFIPNLAPEAHPLVYLRDILFS